jgi:PAS domain S-box-containing protein
MPDNKQTILLVEDEALIAMMEKQQLENEGYKVIHILNGEKAIVFVHENKDLVDLILMDINLGTGLDGTETAKEILRIQNIPILFLSSHTEKAVVEKTEKITNYGYVVKNSSFTVLDASMKMAFKLFESNQEIQHKMTAINDSELRLKRAELLSKAGNWELHLNTGEIIASAGAKTIYGVNKDKFNFEDIKTLSLQEYHSLLDIALKNLLKNDKPYDIEFKIKTQDTGEIKYLHSVATLDKEKRIIFGVIKDITDFKKVEDAFRESELKFSTIFKTMKYPAVIIDTENGSCIDANEAMILNSGYTHSELTLKNAVQLGLLSPNTQAETKKQINEFGRIIDFEVEITTKSGEIRQGLVSGQILTIRNHDYLFQIIVDITEKKKTDEKEKTHQRNIEFLSTTAMQFVEFPEDKNLFIYIGEQLKKIVSKNSYIILNSIDEKTSISTIQAVFGLGKITAKLIKILGKTPEGMSFNVKDQNSYYSDGKVHLYEEGIYGLLLKTIPGNICTSIEKLLNIKDIYIIDLAKKGRFFGSVFIILKNNSGDLKNKKLIETFIKQASIAVQKKQAEDTLRESEKHFSELFQKAPLSYQSLNEEGRFIEINEAWLTTLGYKREEVIGKWFGDFLAPNYVDAFRDRFPIFKAAGKIHSEFKMIHKNGELKFISFEGRIRHKQDGSFGRTHCILQDITERKIAEEKIKTLLAEKELILKDVHHRIKNNMNIMESLLRLQSDQVNTETSNILNDAAGRLQSMMLLYDKLYQSDNFGKLSFKEYISSLLEEITKIFPEEVVFESKIDDFSLSVELLSSLGIIINELITNSMKYAFKKSEGLIKINASNTGDSIFLEYLDNGIGLPESVSFDNSPGFGMQLVKLLVQQIKGTINIERGNGTKFMIEFEV